MGMAVMMTPRIAPPPISEVDYGVDQEEKQEELKKKNKKVSFHDEPAREKKGPLFQCQ